MHVGTKNFFFQLSFHVGDQPNPAPAGQVDYTKAWEEYYKKMGMFYIFIDVKRRLLLFTSLKSFSVSYAFFK